MTSGLQPPSSGAPTPVQGVTGGPPVLGGQISNDPNTGNVVIAPNPGQVLQIRKGNNPTALQVYEYFHTNTDYSRVSLNAQTGGPFQLAVETAPSTVIRGLTIIANGNLIFNVPTATFSNNLIVTGTSQLNGNIALAGVTTISGTLQINNTTTVAAQWNYTFNSPIAVTSSSIFQNTVGPSGGAAVLPAAPFGYMRWLLGGGTYVIPYYAAS